MALPDNTQTQTIGNNIEIKANGISMCYTDFGKGVVPVIFIHGFPFDKSMWEGQINFLKSSHRVIAYDIRGFGKSEGGTEKASIQLFADDLIKLMDALQINKSIICGLSMGGYIALNATYRYPKRFEAIILCDTQCIADSHETKEKRKKNIQQIEEGGLETFAVNFISAVFCKESLMDKREIVETLKGVILATSPKTIIGALKALAERWEMCTSLKEISVPALILCGKEDTIAPVAQSEYLFNNIANAAFSSIDRAGHMSNLEQPDEFNGHINNFISNLAKN